MKTAKLIDLIAAILILLFSYAALSKLLQYRQFKIQLAAQPWLRAYAGFISWLLPLSELLLTVLLMSRRSRFAGFVLAALMLTAFSTYLLLMLNAGYSLPCSCGGIISYLGWKGHIYFNIIFLLLVVLGILLSHYKRPQRQHMP